MTRFASRSRLRVDYSPYPGYQNRVGLGIGPLIPVPRAVARRARDRVCCLATHAAGPTSVEQIRASAKR